MRSDRIIALIVALAGLIAWSLHFGLIYAIATLACLRPQSVPPAFDLRLVSVAMTAILIAGSGLYIVRRLRSDTGWSFDSRNFLHVVTLAAGLLALVAVIWVTLPALMIPDCRTP